MIRPARLAPPCLSARLGLAFALAFLYAFALPLAAQDDETATVRLDGQALFRVAGDGEADAATRPSASSAASRPCWTGRPSRLRRSALRGRSGS